MKAQGPKGSFLFGAGVKFKENPLHFLTKTATQYPRISTFRFGPQRMHLLSDPEYIQYVFQKNYKNYKKGLKVRELKNFLGDGLAIAEGEDWRKKRKLSQPSFSKEKIEKMVTSIVSCTDSYIESWQVNSSVELLEIVSEMKQLTLNIVCETLFSKDLSNISGRLTKSITYLIDHTNSRIQNAYNLPIWFPFGGRGKFLKEKKYVEKAISKIIKERQESTRNYNDLLAGLMSTYNLENGKGLTEQELKEELMTMFLSGTESTAVMLSWIVYLLSKNEEVEAKVNNEIKEVANTTNLSLEQIHKLPYLMAVIEESLRIYPPFWVLARQAINNDEIDGYTIKKGDSILVSPFVMHRSEKYWESPEKFIPERFYKENRKKIKSHIYIPFGDGPRGCIGHHFALMEMQIILVRLYKKFTFTYEGKKEMNMELGFNLTPKNGILIKPKVRE